MRTNTMRNGLAAGLLTMVVAVVQAQVPVVLAKVTEEDRARQNLERIGKALLDFRKVTQLETMMTQSRILQEALVKISYEVFELEVGITKATEIRKALEPVKDQPERFGTLPDSVPRFDEITSAYHALQHAETELHVLLVEFTEQHRDVKVKRKEIEVYRQQFASAVLRAFETATANLALQQNQMDKLVLKRDELVAKLGEMEDKIISAQMQIDQLQHERELAQEVWADLVRRKAEARAEKDIEMAERALREF